MTLTSLADLGWSDFFAHQLSDADLGSPARVCAIHRTRLDAITPQGQVTLVPNGPAGDFAVGDWVLYNKDQVTRLLDRKGLIQRRAAGETMRPQLVAANVDTLGIVTSCNADFNPARLERYAAMAAQADVLPLVILTKADQVEDATTFRKQAEAISPLITAITLNAKDPEDAIRLNPWCSNGETLALLGSSGVGKTTLQNVLTGVHEATQGIREMDAKGRHTTTARYLRATLSGGWLIDTPGMRELGLTDTSEGIDAVFDDIADLALQCRFSDCGHETEPGCAIRAALADGTIDMDRIERWRKLQREEAHNNASIAQSRSRSKQMNKLYDQGRARGARKRRTE